MVDNSDLCISPILIAHQACTPGPGTFELATNWLQEQSLNISHWMKICIIASMAYIWQLLVIFAVACCLCFEYDYYFDDGDNCGIKELAAVQTHTWTKQAHLYNCLWPPKNSVFLSYFSFISHFISLVNQLEWHWMTLSPKMLNDAKCTE